MKPHIIFVSDGSPIVSLGLAAFLVSITNKQIELLSSITILTPEWAPRRYTNALLHVFDNLRLFEYVHPQTRDSYFIKFIIEPHINTLSADDQILYLDFDHIMLEAINLLHAEPSGIIVSSEVKDISTNIITSRVFPKPLPTKHLNTSLIYSNVATLKKLYRPWRITYHKFSPLISMRFLEEVSLGIAAAELHMNALPAPFALQGGCHQPNMKSALFHYGGLSEQASEMKNVLIKLIPKLEQDAAQIYMLGEQAYCELAALIARGVG